MESVGVLSRHEMGVQKGFVGYGEEEEQRFG